MARRERWYVCAECGNDQYLQPRTRGDEFHVTNCRYCFHQAEARSLNSYLKETPQVAKKSVVVYVSATDTNPTTEQVEKIRAHFGLDTVTMGNARNQPVQPTGQLFFTDRHATHAASNAGAVYMGLGYARRVAGVK